MSEIICEICNFQGLISSKAISQELCPNCYAQGSLKYVLRPFKRAIFLDRDGVITKPIYDTNRNIFRPPWSVSETVILPFVIESLQKLSSNGYSLFLVTNQPDFVKGLVDIKDLKEIRQYVSETLISNKVNLINDYYCFHHPDYCICKCRKPSPYFLIQASKIYGIDMSQSWMVGDMNKDIICGQRAGVKTILINNIDLSETHTCKPTYICRNIKEATEIILCN